MRFRPSDLFTVFIIVVLVGAVAIASQWVLRAGIIVLALGSVGIVLATAQLFVDCLTRSASATESTGRTLKFELPTVEDTDPRAALMGTLEIWAWLIGLVLAVPIIGLPLALPLFVLVYAQFYGASWRLAGVLALLIGGFIFGVYQQIMRVYWPESLLGYLLEGM